MEVAEVVITGMLGTDIPWGEAKLFPLGDVQWGVEDCDAGMLKEYIQEGKEQKGYFLGMGDYLDVASPSNRAKLRAMDLYDSVEDALEDSTRRNVESLMKILEPTAGRWLGMLEGHHFYEFRDGTTSDMALCQALEAPFLGTCAFVRMRFNKPSSAAGYVVDVWCHHGAGSGQTTAAPLQKLEPIVRTFDADIYLIGHHHKRVSAPLEHLYLTQRRPYKVQARTRVVACTGGWLRGYTQGKMAGRQPRGNYIERGMLTPTNLGGIVVKISPRHVADGDYYLPEIKVEM